MALDTEFVLRTVVEGTDEARSQIQSLQNSLTQLSSAMTVAGAAITIGITNPLIRLGAEMVKISADAEETQSKFGAVFEELSTKGEADVNRLSAAFGRSSDIIRQNVADYGALLRGAGLTGDALEQMSVAAVQLSKDLASFHNTSDEQAFDAIRSGIVGMSRPLQEYGININQANLQQEAFKMGINDSVETMDQYHLSLVRLFAIVDLAQKQNSFGDLVRTFDSFSNSVKHLQSNMHDIELEFGTLIKGAIRPLLEEALRLTDQWKQLDEPTKVLILQIAATAAAVGPLLLGFGLLTGAISALMTPLGLAVVAMTAISAAFAYFYIRSETFRNSINDIVAAIVGFTEKLINLKEQSLLFQAVVITLAGAISGILLKALVDIAATITATVVPALAALALEFAPFFIAGAVIGAVVAGIYLLVTNWDKAVELIKKAAKAIPAALESVYFWFIDLPKKVAPALIAFGKSIFDYFASIPQKIYDALTSNEVKIKVWFDSLPSKMAVWAAQGIAAFTNIGQFIGTAVGNGIVQANINGKLQEAIAAGAPNNNVGGIAAIFTGSIVKDASALLGKAVTAVKSFSQKAIAAGTESAEAIKNNIKAAYSAQANIATSSSGGGALSSAIASIPKNAMALSEPLFQQINDQYEAFFSRVSQYPEKLQAAFKDMYDAYTKTSTGIGAELDSLAADFNKNMESIAASIANNNGRLEDLVTKYNDTVTKAHSDLISKFVDATNEITDISKQIADKQADITINAAKMVTQHLKEQYEASLKILDDQKIAVDAQIDQAKSLADAYKQQTSELDKQNKAVTDRQNIQNDINQSVLAINRAQRAVDAPAVGSDVDVLNAQLQEALYKRQQADQALVDFDAKAARDSQQAILDATVNGLKDQQTVITNGIQSLQNANSIATQARQAADDNAALTAQQKMLNEQLTALQDKLDTEQTYLDRAMRREEVSRREVSRAVIELGKSELASFISDWDRKSEISAREFEKSRQDIVDQTNLYVYQRDQEVQLYADAQVQIAHLQDVATDVYTKSINQQVLATAAGTDLMKQYFSKVNDTVKDLGSSINGVNNIKFVGSSTQSKNIPVSSFSAPSSSQNSVTINTDNFIGTQQFATDMGNKIVKALGLNIHF